MADWPRFIAMIFYAPMRGMREVRDRGSLGPAVLTAFLVQVACSLILQLLAGDRSMFKAGPSALGGIFFSEIAPILTIAIIFTPVSILIANLFDRRGSFGVVLQQEYGSLASALFYVLIGANLLTVVAAALLHFSGFQAGYVASAAQSQDSEQIRSMIQMLKLTPDQIALFKAQMSDPVYVSRGLFSLVNLPLLVVGGVL